MRENTDGPPPASGFAFGRPMLNECCGSRPAWWPPAGLYALRARCPPGSPCPPDRGPRPAPACRPECGPPTPLSPGRVGGWEGIRAREPCADRLGPAPEPARAESDVYPRGGEYGRRFEAEPGPSRLSRGRDAPLLGVCPPVFGDPGPLRDPGAPLTPCWYGFVW